MIVPRRKRLSGQVRVGGQILPIRTFVLGGVVVPVPWGEREEGLFRKWWATEGKRYPQHTNPDSEKQKYDWRAAWWMGFRGIGKGQISFLPPVRKTPERQSVPEHKIQVFAR